MNSSSTDPDSQHNQAPKVTGERIVYVMPEHSFVTRHDNAVDLREIWDILWRGKWLIVAVTSIFAIGSVTFALLQAEWYRAEVLLAPADEKARPSLSGQLGGLAAFAGVNVADGRGVEALAVLRSREFARAFIEEFELLPVFFADEWDSVRETWSAQNPEEWRDIRDGVDYFHNNIFKVEEDRQTRLVSIAVEWKEPQTAADWANDLARRLNARVREQALREAEANVAYLQAELAATNLITLQQSIGRLLEGELQKLMLARGNEEFAFRIIDAAEPAKYRARPKRRVIAVLGTALGGLLGMFLVFLVHSIRATPESDS
jgi:uncharacterized protein involved in exopolysaccharide biosynthesis